MSSLTAAIRSEGLTKEYKNGRGCREITIQVGQGEAFGFLGPNGAGKSTFVKMMVGLISPSHGEASLLGYPIGSLDAKRQIGYLPELYRYQEWLTGEEVVRLHGKLCGLERSALQKRIPQLLEEVGIGLRGKDRVKHYSKGMQQRLGLACALVADPPVVFLDEPSSALDPIGRREVRRILAGLKDQGKTIFLNSHLLEDVEALCDRMALLNNGQILRHGTVAEMLQKRTLWRFRVGGFIPAVLPWLHEVSGCEIRLSTDTGTADNRNAVRSSSDSSSLAETVWLEAELDQEDQAGWLNHLMMEQGMTLYEAGPVKERLEEWFMDTLTGLSHRGERECT
ncbi:ABC transporter ATP-binding protein [Paenibacillus lutrae]|uniref:ATP-binding cassette domain-containing protein n=1 Tax=Paenibacillus lutrae TaxID=2078573 RepID=A0A7X3FEB0_9BACL|nr:ABC transporter ATP-binding protein [Paenibacillus lutrae]MVO98110.1 ATP-binding cassette domain-containing protein [Paenibacillus lutrae]